MKNSLLFPMAIGITDGIITTLMLATNYIVEARAISLLLSLRIAAGSAMVGSFSYFVAEYSSLREELARISKHLGLSTPSFLIRSKPGRDILEEAIVATGISGGFSFSGSFFPLLVATVFPGNATLSLSAAIIALGATGLAIAKSVSGNMYTWPVSMMSIGALVAFAGNFLHLIS